MLEGVAIVLFHEGRVFMVREHQSKPSIGKRAGMLSIPMETCGKDEGMIPALKRMFHEEMGLWGKCVCHLAGSICMRPVPTEEGIPYVIHCFVGRVLELFVEEPQPQDTEDVSFAGWMTLTEIHALGDGGRREIPTLLHVCADHFPTEAG